MSETPAEPAAPAPADTAPSLGAELEAKLDALEAMVEQRFATIEAAIVQIAMPSPPLTTGTTTAAEVPTTEAPVEQGQHDPAPPPVVEAAPEDAPTEAPVEAPAVEAPVDPAAPAAPSTEGL